MLEKLTDEKLMARYQQGELPAFEVLLGRHRRGVYHFLLRSVGHPETAEDLLQDVFLRVVHSRASFEQRSRFTTWLYTIARNLCIDHARKARHRHTTSLDQPLRPGEESEMTLHQRLSSDDPAPDREAHNRRLRETIRTAVAALSEEQREVFLMREEAGLPFEEISQIVGAPINTVKSRMRYALQHLRASLSAAGIEP